MKTKSIIQTKILLNHCCQKFGWIMFLPFVALLFANNYFEFELNWLRFEIGRDESTGENFTYEIALMGAFISIFLIAYLFEKKEDEYIQRLTWIHYVYL